METNKMPVVIEVDSHITETDFVAAYCRSAPRLVGDKGGKKFKVWITVEEVKEPV